jgi:hypothetical protein
MPLTHWLATALLLAGTAVAKPGPVRAEQIPVDLELVLAVDMSGSIDREEATLQRQGYLAALIHPKVIEAIRSGPSGRIAVIYVEWAGERYQRTVVDWGLVDGEQSAKAFAAALAVAPILTERWTSISAGIDYAVGLLENNDFVGPRRVIDVSGDGYNNSGRPVTAARDEAVSKGITINGLPILNDKPGPGGWPPAADLDKYYEANVIGGPGAFIVPAESFETFAQAILSKMILEIAQHDGTGRQRYAAADR